MDFFIVFIILLAFDETIIVNIKKGTIWLDALQFIKKRELGFAIYKTPKTKIAWSKQLVGLILVNSILKTNDFLIRKAALIFHLIRMFYQIFEMV